MHLEKVYTACETTTPHAKPIFSQAKGKKHPSSIAPPKPFPLLYTPLFTDLFITSIPKAVLHDQPKKKKADQLLFNPLPKPFLFFSFLFGIGDFTIKHTNTSSFLPSFFFGRKKF
jgi:hypothetical protein